MVFKNNSSFFLMLSTVRKLKRKCTIHYKGQNAAPIRPEPRQRPRRPGRTRRRSAGKEKAADPGAGDRQLCQSRKVVRAKVVKSLGIVVSHSRKSRSVLRVIVAGRTHHIFQILLLQVLGGNLISELLVGSQHDLLLVRIAHVVLH